MNKRRSPAAPEKQPLEEVVERLTDEVRFLRQAIDEFREDFVHMLRNLPDNLPPPYAHLPSMAASFEIKPEKPEASAQPSLMTTQQTPPPVESVTPRKQTLFD